MSYYVVYAIADAARPPEDGEQVATGRGWLNWSDYVLAGERADDFPEAAHLGQEGWTQWGGENEPADAGDLTHELEQLTHADDADVAAVSARLLAAVSARPADCCGILVTDGSEPDPDDPDDEDDED